MSNSPPNLLSGARLVEMVMVALVSSAISGTIVSYASVRVMESEMTHLRTSHDDLKQEVRELRRDLYAPLPWRESSMSEPVLLIDLIGELRSSLLTSAAAFPGLPGDPEAEPPVAPDPDADFRRHLTVAQAELARYAGASRVLIGELHIQAGVGMYTEVPEDLIDVQLPIWGTDHQRELWAADYPGALPRLSLGLRADGERVLLLVPAPSAHQVQVLGDTYRYFYSAGFSAGDGALLLSDRDRSLLLLRAQAEACKELAMRGMTKPVEVRSGQPVQTRNQTPRAIWEALMHEFRLQTGQEVASA